MDQVICTVKLPSGALASRESAKPFRQLILSELTGKKEGIVNIELSEVKAISGSFADECIGVLVM